MLDAARREPNGLFIGVDPVAAAMAASSNRARREGLTNALFVVASIESMPVELTGVADRVTVLFPWGSLLLGVTQPDPRALATLACLARSRARLDVAINRSALPFGAEHLAERYRPAGIVVKRLDWVVQPPFRTTWGQRVMHGSDALHLYARFDN